MPNCVSLSKQSNLLFTQCNILEKTKPLEGLNKKNEELPFLSEIVYRRIKTLNLPISLTKGAYLAISAFCSNPGEAVVLLIDCLTHYEGELVTTDKLLKLYPWGFYSPAVFQHIVDNYLKPRKVKWAEVY